MNSSISSNCPCKRIKCERHGNCSACKKYHSALKRNPLTTCQRMQLKAKMKNRKA